MRQLLLGISKVIDSINDWVGQYVSWLNLGLVLLVCGDVIVRRVLGNSSAGINELEWHIFALVFLLGMGYTFKHDRHVRVDLFYHNFKPKDKARVDFIGTLIFLLPWSAILLFYAWGYTAESFRMGETSPDPGGLPARYLIKGAISIGMLLLFLQGISQVIKNAFTIWDNSSTEVDQHQNAQ